LIAFFLDLGASFLAVLVSLALFLMLFYLLSTERRAPHVGVWEGNQTQNLLVSIVVAARNEENEITPCLASLIAQNYPRIEVIVVDDNSTDKTLLIAKEFEKDPRVRVISAGPKPKGWVGKSWPCQKGYEASKGDVLLFVDADSVLEPKALEYSVKLLENNSIDMLSISPKVVLRGIWAKATLPLVSAGINLLYPLTKVNDPNNKRAYVFGTFILVRKSVYSSIGGHEAIKDRIVEDAAIAQLTKSKGFKLKVLIGDDLLTTVWESELSTIYRGMERVFSDSIRSYGLVSLLDAIVVFFLGLYPITFIIGFVGYSAFVRNLFLGSTIGSLILNVGLVACVLSVLLCLAVQANELHLVKGKQEIRFAPLLYPIGFCFFMSAIVSSTIKVSRSRGIEWKGQKFEQRTLVGV
jgi:chlorobactene glucosyltransferase